MGERGFEARHSQGTDWQMRRVLMLSARGVMMGLKLSPKSLGSVSKGWVHMKERTRLVGLGWDPPLGIPEVEDPKPWSLHWRGWKRQLSCEGKQLVSLGPFLE